MGIWVNPDSSAAHSKEGLADRQRRAKMQDRAKSKTPGTSSVTVSDVKGRNHTGSEHGKPIRSGLFSKLFG
jgi:hypothetical protein